MRPEEGEPVIFPCRCWLAEDKDDGKLDRVLIPGESLAPPPDSKFKEQFRLRRHLCTEYKDQSINNLFAVVSLQKS